MEPERTASDWLELIAAATKPSKRPSPWPACGAKLRGPRAGRTCKAAGCGVGGRCALHGGVPSSRPRGMATPRRFVLFANLLDEHESRRWSWHAVPLDVFEGLSLVARLHPDAESMPFEIAESMRARGKRNVGRFGQAVKWPQPLGFRVVRRLAERGRVAFVAFSDANQRAVLRAQREHVAKGQPPRDMQRVDGEAFARALALAGTTRRGAAKIGPDQPPASAGTGERQAQVVLSTSAPASGDGG